MFLSTIAETETHEGKRKVEALWPIFKLVLLSFSLSKSQYIFANRIHHQKSRYVFDLFYKRKAINRGTQKLMNLMTSMK